MESSFNLLAFLWGWIKIACFFIGAANVITFWTPTNSKIPIVQGGLDVLNIASLNVWKNKNKDETRA